MRPELLSRIGKPALRFAGAAICLSATLALSPALSFAQRYTFRNTTEGLRDLNVNCIAQDRTGYLWVGTENGLYRYDGVQFRQFGAAEGIRARNIQNLFVGSDGTLWAATTAAVYFERRDGKFTELLPPAPVDGFSQRIGTSFAALAPDRVAMADRAGAFLLRRVADEQWVAEPMHLEGQKIWSISVDPSGTVWYGCDDDLCRQSGGHTTHLRASLGLPSDTWLHLLWSRDGHLWIRGLAHLGEIDPQDNRFTAHELPGTTPPVPYLVLAEDGQGRIAANQGPDFGLWQDGHWRMITARNGLTHNDLSALFVDREGSLWFGVIGHGLTRWLGQRAWEAYTNSEGLSNDIAWASLRDSTGRFWIGTEGGVNYLAPDAEQAIAWQQRGVESTRAVSMAEDGGVWIGSAAGSLIHIDEHTLAGKQWTVPEVYRVLADGKRVWVATGGGLFTVDTESPNPTPALVEDAAIAKPHDRFTDLSMDKNHRLWVASDQGLLRFDSNGWKRIDPGLAGVNPSIIAADGNGNLWAAGNISGVMRLRVEGDRINEAQHIGRPPLTSEQVVAIALDRRGWVWLGQDAGISVFDGHTWRTFTQDDGLIWNDIDSNGISEDKDGSMWIGTSGGISHLIAPQTAPAGPPRAPVFSDVRFGNAAVQEGSSVTWSSSPLAVSVSALSFRDDRHLRMRYRLVGLENDWVETTDKSVRYPQLGPGDYRFEAIAVDAATGAASPTSAISFQIAPRWWQSRLIPLAFSLLAGIAVLALVRMRVHSLQGQKAQLEQAVQRRTEDLEREKLELLDARDQLRHYAEHDGLTGLWNHRIIIDRLRNEIDRSLRQGSAIGVILVDVDHFKHVNDTFGHPGGDAVLRELGDIFVRSVRSYDWVGRYGGEEFLLILPGSSLVAARNRAEHLRRSVESLRVKHGEALIHVTASFGVAAGFPTNYETIIQAADAALYRAKDNGRNCVIGTEVEPVEGGMGIVTGD